LPFEENYNGAEALESYEDQDYSADEPSSEAGFEQIVGRSAALRRVLREVRGRSSNRLRVLIQGETGTERS
jgi:transcriptional regulator with GAF, ATPase, and Fis domain